MAEGIFAAAAAAGDVVANAAPYDDGGTRPKLLEAPQDFICIMDDWPYLHQRRQYLVNLRTKEYVTLPADRA